MGEFTGDYYRCDSCYHIWDYNDDACPNCGSKNVDEINAKEVLQWASIAIPQASERLKKMLESHDDLS